MNGLHKGIRSACLIDLVLAVIVVLLLLRCS